MMIEVCAVWVLSKHGFVFVSGFGLWLMLKTPCKMHTAPNLMTEPKLEPDLKPRFGKGPNVHSLSIDLNLDCGAAIFKCHVPYYQVGPMS